MCEKCLGMATEVLNAADYETMTDRDKIELAMRIIDWLASDATEDEKGDPHKPVRVLRGILSDLFGDCSE